MWLILLLLGALCIYAIVKGRPVFGMSGIILIVIVAFIWYAEIPAFKDLFTGGN